MADPVAPTDRPNNTTAARTADQGGAKPKRAKHASSQGNSQNRKKPRQRAADKASVADDLIACLAKVSRWADQPKTPEALTAGMAWRGDETSLDTLVAWLISAAERSGFSAGIKPIKAQKLTAADLPAILVTQDRPCLLISLQDDIGQV